MNNVINFPLVTMAESNLITLCKSVDAIKEFLPLDAIARAEIRIDERPLSGYEALKLIAGEILMLAEAVDSYQEQQNNIKRNEWWSRWL